MSDDEGVPRPPLAVGQTIAERFLLLEQLPPGGSAIVFRARDTIADEELVVKIGRLPRSQDRSLLDQFRKMRKLKSANVVACLGFFQHEVWSLIALELVDGETFGDFARSASRPQLLLMLRQIAEALDALTIIGLRHGDLTGRNILVRNQAPVLIDPDAGSIPSAPGQSNDDFANLMRLVRETGALDERREELQRFETLATRPRPFNAVAEALGRATAMAAPFAPSPERRSAMRRAYERRISKGEGAYLRLVGERNDVFEATARSLEALAAEVGFTQESVSQDDSQARAKELDGRSNDMGELLNRRRTFRSGGREWTFTSYGVQEFLKPTPWKDERVAIWGSMIRLSDNDPLLDERFRVLHGRRLELCTVADQWVDAPADWIERTAEILIGERLPGIAAPTEIKFHLLDSRDTESTVVRARDGSLTESPEEDGLEDLRLTLETRFQTKRGTWNERPYFGTHLFDLGNASEGMARSIVVKSFEDDFARPYSRFLSACHRYDVVRSDNLWFLDVSAVLSDRSQTLVNWRFELPWLETAW